MELRCSRTFAVAVVVVEVVARIVAVAAFVAAVAVGCRQQSHQCC